MDHRGKRILLTGFVFILLSSCISKYKDFGINSNAEIIAPLAYGSFNLGEILGAFNKDSVFNKDSSSELSFSYRDDKVAKIKFNQIVNFPSQITLANKTQQLGVLKLAAHTFNDSITISILKQRLPNNQAIQQMPENETAMFPKINLGNESSNSLRFEINDFDFLKSGHFISGDLKVEFRNDFPTSCKAVLELVDQNEDFIEEAEFGTSKANGLEPGKTELVNIDLAGKDLQTPLYYKVKSLQLASSDNQVFIEPSNGIYLSGQISNMTVEYGIFKSNRFNYTSDPEQIQLDINDSIQLSKLIIETGTIKASLKKTFEATGTLRIYIPSLKRNGTIFYLDIPLSSNSMNKVNADISGTELYLSNEKYSFNSIEYYTQYISNNQDKFIELKSTDTYTSAIDLSNLKFSFAEGNFGNIKLELAENGIQINEELWDLISGDIFGANPILTLFFSNPVGVPILFDMHIDAFNRNGEKATLSNTPYILPYPQTVDEAPLKSELEFNSSNSNIFDFMTLPPNDSMNFVASIELNPEGTNQNELTNFVDLKDPFQIGLEFQVPLLLSGEFFKYADTIPLASSNIDQLLKSAKVTFKTNNSIPLQIDLTVTPFDTIQDTTTGDKIFVTLLNAAQVDEFGNVTSATEASNTLQLTEEALHSIANANSLLINVSFLSPNDGTSPAKLKNEYGFDLKMFVDANPNF